MNAPYAASPKARFVAFVGAVLASFTVLGGTVFGMQAGQDEASAQMLALQRASVTSTASN